MACGLAVCCQTGVWSSRKSLALIVWLAALAAGMANGQASTNPNPNPNPNSDTNPNSNSNSTHHDPNSPCPFNTYGMECQNRCSANCKLPGCDVVNGNCVGGCKNGFYGEQCLDVCPQGFFGLNCSMECSRNCKADVCDPVIGVCEKGCTSGWVGRRCSNMCRQGYYGDNCRMKCSNNCATKDCHHQSGYCLNGCKQGFWGSDCSLFGDIQDIPDKVKARFYSKLTAESRSVLLYLLMGEYERTLESAQMQINRGIKQRNELKHLING